MDNISVRVKERLYAAVDNAKLAPIDLRGLEDWERAQLMELVAAPIRPKESTLECGTIKEFVMNCKLYNG